MAKRRLRRFHESTSRAFSRLAFITLGLIPLFLCLALCVGSYLPIVSDWRVYIWERELTSTLGLDVQIQSVEWSTPQRTQLIGVQFQDRETSLPIAQAELVEVEQYRGQWIVKIPNVRVQGTRLAKAWQDLHERFLCCPLDTYEEAHLVFDSVSFFENLGTNEAASSSSVPSLEQLSVKVVRETDSTRLLCDFQVEEVSTDGHSEGSDGRPIDASAFERAPIRLALERMHQTDEPFTKVYVAALGTPLPCSLVSFAEPSIEHLGKSARLFGAMQMEVYRNSWTATVGGVNSEGEPLPGLALEEINFESLCWNAPTADVTGTGAIRLQQAKVDEGGASYLHGELMAQQGRVRGDFLHAFAIKLGVGLDPSLVNAERDAAFEKASVLFLIDASKSSIQLAGGLEFGDLLRDSARSVAWRTKGGEQLPLENLIEVFQDSSYRRVSVADVEGEQAELSTRAPSSTAKFIERWLPIRANPSLGVSQTAKQTSRITRAIR